MVDRFVITLMIVAGLSLLWLGWCCYKRKLVGSIQVDVDQAGKPALLYFTADYCAACKFQQKPVVERIVAKFGDAITVKEVDVVEQPDLANRFKVLTLPTTVVLDRFGQVVQINYGLTPQAQLERQLL
jgi:thioredoxin 1